MGPSFHIKSVAEGLYKHHPDYYFLIDRDHYEDSYVNKCWSNFPDPSTPNLLIWYRREIENYFLDSDYLSKSSYISVSNDKIDKSIIKYCKDRLYIDAANQVIISIREDLKSKWIELFTDTNEFKSKEAALKNLTESIKIKEQKKKANKTLQEKEIIGRFANILTDMTGGKEHLEYGYGTWIERIRGKKILPSLVTHCFDVKDARNNSLKGKEKLNQVVKDLLQKPLIEQPLDFQKLHEIIIKRLTSR